MKKKEKILLSGNETFRARRGVLLGHTHSCRVNGTDLEAGRIQRAHLLLEFVGGRERVVT